MQSTSFNQSPVSLVTVCLLLLVLATSCKAEGEINPASVAVPIAVILGVPVICLIVVFTIAYIVSRSKPPPIRTSTTAVQRIQFSYAINSQNTGMIPKQVEIQLPQAGLHEGEAPPRYEEAVTMEGYYRTNDIRQVVNNNN